MDYRLIFGLAMLTLLIMQVFHAKARHDRDKTTQQRLLPLLLGTWAALYLLHLPFADPGRGSVVQSFLRSALESLQVFALNREAPAFAVLKEIEGAGCSHGFAWVYVLVMNGLYLVAPLLTFTYVIQFFHGPISWLNWKIGRALDGVTGRSGETWFFSSPSEQALQFYRSMLPKEKPGNEPDGPENRQNTRKREWARETRTAFFCASEEGSYDKVVRDGACPFVRGIGDMPPKFFDVVRPSVFFFSEDEERNLREALAFISRFREWQKADRHVDRTLLLYVLTSSPSAELLLNSALKQGAAPSGRAERNPRGILVRRIAPNRAIVYRELQVCKPAELSRERVSFLVIGCGWIGEELVRALLWMYAGSDSTRDFGEVCRLTGVDIWVVDQEDKKKVFYRRYPGLKDEMPGEDNFRLHFITSPDVGTFDLETDADQAGEKLDPDGIDMVYVCLGNDTKNIDTALYLRRDFRRLKIKKKNGGGPVNDNDPPIRVAVRKPEDFSFHFTDGRNSYNILPFCGESEDFDGYYSMETLLNPRLEACALVKHCRYDLSKLSESDKSKYRWKDLERKVQTQREDFTHKDFRECAIDGLMQGDISRMSLFSFYGSDYNARSSRSRAEFELLFQDRLKELGKTQRNRLEHQRWQMYMRTEGYRVADQDVIALSSPKILHDRIAKLHGDLVPFDNLPPGEQEKDA